MESGVFFVKFRQHRCYQPAPHEADDLGILLASGIPPERIPSVCRDFEAELIEFSGEEDHVHLGTAEK